MDFATFQKSVDSLVAWRAAKGEPAHVFPDSRDPEFQPSVTSQEFEQAIVCLAAWRENREGLYAGMIAIVHVINNRAKRGWYEGNLYFNVTHNTWLSSMIDPENGQLAEYPEENDREFSKLLGYVEDLYEGTLLDRTDGSLYYLKSTQDTTGYSLYPRLATIGQMVFYGEIEHGTE